LPVLEQSFQQLPSIELRQSFQVEQVFDAAVLRISKAVSKPVEKCFLREPSMAQAQWWED
jgi:hypothetical protein